MSTFWLDGLRTVDNSDDATALVAFGRVQGFHDVDRELDHALSQPLTDAGRGLVLPAAYGALLFGQVLTRDGWARVLLTAGAVLQVLGVLMVFVVLRRTGRRLATFLASSSATVHVRAVGSVVSIGDAVIMGGSAPTTDQRLASLESKVAALGAGLPGQIASASEQLRRESAALAQQLEERINAEVQRLAKTLKDMGREEARLQVFAAAVLVLGILTTYVGSMLSL